MARRTGRGGARVVAVAAGLLAAGAMTAPAQAADRTDGPALQTVTRCSDFGGMGDMKVCVSTGPREPTIAWFDNKSGVTHFGAILKITNDDLTYSSQTGPFTAHAHSINGMRRDGLANDCYYGYIRLDGGRSFWRTAESACV